MADHVPGVEISLKQSVPQQRVAGDVTHVATRLRELTDRCNIEERQYVHVDAKLINGGKGGNNGVGGVGGGCAYWKVEEIGIRNDKRGGAGVERR